MTSANVSIDALIKVGVALKNFRTDITQFSDNVCHCIGESESQCQVALDTLAIKILELERDIGDHRYQITRLECVIDDYEICINQVKDRIEELERRISEYSDEIQSLDSASDPEDYYRIQDRNNGLNKEISFCEYKIKVEKERKMCLENELQGTEKALNVIKSEFDELKAKLSEKEQLKATLDIAVSNVRHELENLQETSKQFCRNVLEEANGNISGIDRCIQYAKEYASINL